MNSEIRITLPEKVRFIIGELYKAGYEAFAVGGCVRDSLLGREPKDWDITTIASPKEIKSCFRHTIDTGIQHGTVTVMIDHEGFEVTTYRVDGKYEDNRHPSWVSFTRDLKEDLARRDFTINAMAYNEEAGLIDPFDGRGDLKRGVIRAVGDAGSRFGEDALRILRGVRFAAELGFELEEKTGAAMKPYAKNLRNVSAERIRVELKKLIMGKKPEKIELLVDNGIAKIVFSEWLPCVSTGQECRYHDQGVAGHIITSLKAMHALLGLHEDEEYYFGGRSFKDYGLKNYGDALTEKEKTLLCLVMLLHDIGKPDAKTVKNGEAHFYGHEKLSAKMAGEILRRQKYDNETIENAVKLVAHHDDRHRFKWRENGDEAARRLANKLGEELLRLLIIVQYADVLAHAPAYIESGIEDCRCMEKSIERFLEKREPFLVKMLDINGRDLMDAGIDAGREIGFILDELMLEVLDDPSINKKDELIRRGRMLHDFGTKIKYPKLFFDLDGTLTDSATGIIRCHEYALLNMGIAREDFGDLSRYIGPPLAVAYKDYFDTEDEIREAVRLYRVRYNDVGWKENRVYDGMAETLAALKEKGHSIYMATSKPEAYAKRIAQYFGFDKYFDGIYGASSDDKRSSKADVLAYALENAGVELDGSGHIARPYEALMIGDRFYDVDGAKEFGMRTLGVSYGFGTEKELLRAGAVFVAEGPQDIEKFLRI